MDRFHELASRQQADALLSNLVLLGANSPGDLRTELVLVNDEEAGRLGAFVSRHLYLQEITLTLLAVTDPAKQIASLVEYVRHHRALTTLSLVTALLLNPDGSSTLEKREMIVDAFLKAAIDNPSITSVSLNCCRFKSGRMAQLLEKPLLRDINLANCRSFDDLSLPGKKDEFLLALGRNVSLETFCMRRSFETASLEGDILLRLAMHPRLTKIGLSIQGVANAAIFRRLIESYQRPMQFSLLGCELRMESAGLLIEGFHSRRIGFGVELKGCKWDSDATRELFLRHLVLSPRLLHLSIDEHCGLSACRIWYLQETVALLAGTRR